MLPFGLGREVDGGSKVSRATDEGAPFKTQQLTGPAGRDPASMKQIHHDGLARSPLERLLLLQERGDVVVQHHGPHSCIVRPVAKERLVQRKRGSAG